MNKDFRLHPFDIFGGIRIYLFILVIPLFRGLGSIGEGVAQWLKGAWIDISALAVIIILGVLRWKRSRITISDFAVRYTRGLFFRYTDIYIVRHTATVMLKRPFYIRPFRASVVKLYSLGKTRREFRPLILSIDDARAICDFLTGCGDGHIVMEPDYVDVAFTSAASSTIAGGIAFLFALVSNIGHLLGEGFGKKLYGVFSDIAGFFAFGLPPVFIMVPLGIFVLYLLAFLQKLSAYYRIKLSRGDKTLTVSGGLFGKYVYGLSVSKISSIDFGFRLILRLFKRYSVLIGIPGYGGGGFLPVLVPSNPLLEAARGQKSLLPEFSGYYCPIRPDIKSFRLHNSLPFLALAALSALSLSVCAALLPEFRTFVIIWGSVFVLLFLWEAFNKAYAACQTGIGFHRDHISAMYELHRVFHRVILPKQKIIGIKITQDPLQKRYGTCRVVIYERGLRAKKHIIRAMPLEVIQCNISGCRGFNGACRDK